MSSAGSVDGDATRMRHVSYPCPTASCRRKRRPFAQVRGIVFQWRWRESNPRPPASRWAFSERSRQGIVGGAAAAGNDGVPYPAKRPRSPAGAAYEQAPLDDARSPARGAEAGRTTLLFKQRTRAGARRLFCVPALLRGSGDHGSLFPPRRPESKPFTPSCWQCHRMGWRNGFYRLYRPRLPRRPFLPCRDVEGTRRRRAARRHRERQPWTPHLWALRSARADSRSASRERIAWRLS